MPYELSAQLDHLVIESENPQQLSKYYSEALGARCQHNSGEILCEAPERRISIVKGAKRHLKFAAFKVANLDALDDFIVHLDKEDIEAQEQVSSYFSGPSVAVRDPDGNVMAFGVAKDVASLSPQIPPARLQHFAMATPNISAMVDHYQRLGFVVSDRVLDDAQMLSGCFLRSDHEHHSLALFRAAASGFDHFCHEIPDWNAIRDWADHFSRHNQRITWGPGRHGPGNNLFLFVTDPDGNWLEFSAELELISRDRPEGKWKHCEKTLNSWGDAYLRDGGQNAAG